jgi:hypothetical protein
MNFSIDSTVWVFIILFLIVFTLQVVDEKAIQNNFNIEKKVFFISEMLVSTPGVPENWDVFNVKQVGLTKKDNEYYKKCHLDQNKITNLMQLDYDKLINLLDVENIKIKFQNQEIGHSKQKAKITRYCNCGGVQCELQIEM